jgi:hypothetical protein
VAELIARLPELTAVDPEWPSVTRYQRGHLSVMVGAGAIHFDAGDGRLRRADEAARDKPCDVPLSRSRGSVGGHARRGPRPHPARSAKGGVPPVHGGRSSWDRGAVGGGDPTILATPLS